LEQGVVDWKRRWKLQSLPYMHTKFGELWSTNDDGTFFNTFKTRMHGKAQPDGRPALQIIKTPFLHSRNSV